jgi:hypothetical protein
VNTSITAINPSCVRRCRVIGTRKSSINAMPANITCFVGIVGADTGITGTIAELEPFVTVTVTLCVGTPDVGLTEQFATCALAVAQDTFTVPVNPPSPLIAAENEVLPFFGTLAVAGTVKLKSHTVPLSPTVVVAVPFGSARLPVTAPAVVPVGGASVMAIVHVPLFATAVFEQVSLPITKLLAETVACPGVTDAPVLFVKVTVCAALVSPINVPVNVKLVGFAVNAAAVFEPLPLSAIATVSCGVTTVNVADSAPFTDGVKITPSEQAVPAATDAPQAGPPGPVVALFAKSAAFVPVIAGGNVSETAAEVLFVIVTYCAGELVPIITVPKFSVTGDTPIVGMSGASATNAFEIDAAGNTFCGAPSVIGNGVAPEFADDVCPTTYALLDNTAMPFTASGELPPPLPPAPP